MSDRVAYFVGNTKGRDHIQWPTILRSEIELYTGLGPLTTPEQDAIWPADLNLAQIMALAWRVKKWKLTGSCAVQETNVDGIVTRNGTANAVVDADVYALNHLGGIAIREADLVGFDMGAPFHSLINGGAAALDGAHVSDWDITVNASTTTGTSVVGINGSVITQGMQLFASAPSPWVLFNPGTKRFSPALRGPGYIVGGGFFDRMHVIGGVNRTPQTNLSGIGPDFLQFPGEMIVESHIAPSFTVPLQLSWRYDFQAVGSTYTGSGSLNLRLEAVEFWRYKTIRGDPVYDASNGSQLADPYA